MSNPQLIRAVDTLGALLRTFGTHMDTERSLRVSMDEMEKNAYDIMLNDSLDAVLSGLPKGTYRKCYYGIDPGMGPWASGAEDDGDCPEAKGFVFLPFTKGQNNYYILDCDNGKWESKTKETLISGTTCISVLITAIGYIVY